MTNISETLDANFSGLKKSVDDLPRFFAEEFQVQELERARGVKWMRIPQLLQGVPSGGVLNVGENTGTGTLVGPRSGYAWFLTRLVVDGLFAGSAAASLTSLESSGTATDPAAGGVIAQITAVPAGTYAVQWTVSLQGTVTSGDANNMNLNNGAAAVVTAVFPGTAGNYSQPPVTITVAAGATVSVKAIAAASGASAVYGATLTLTPVAVAADSVSLYRTSNVITQPPLWTFSGAQGQQQLTSGKARLTLLYGDSLTLYGTGLTATGTIRLSGELIEMPQERMGLYV